jgi:anti-anti-sigma factor
VTSAGSAPPGFEIRTLRQAGVCVLAVAGDVVVETAPPLEVELALATGTDSDVVLDLSEVSFMDSTGLRVILSARNDAVAAGQRFVLVVLPDGQIDGLLDFTEVKDALATAPTREQALVDLASSE